MLERRRRLVEPGVVVQHALVTRHAAHAGAREGSPSDRRDAGRAIGGVGAKRSTGVSKGPRRRVPTRISTPGARRPPGCRARRRSGLEPRAETGRGRRGLACASHDSCASIRSLRWRDQSTFGRRARSGARSPAPARPARRGRACPASTLERLPVASPRDMAREGREQPRRGRTVDRLVALGLGRVDLLRHALLDHVVPAHARDAHAARVPAVGVEEHVVVHLHVPARVIGRGMRRPLHALAAAQRRSSLRFASSDSPCRRRSRSPSNAGSTARNFLRMRFTCEVIVPSSTTMLGVAHELVAVLHVAGMARERMHHPELGQVRPTRPAAPRGGHALARRARAARGAARRPRPRRARRELDCGGTARRCARARCGRLTSLVR